MLFMYGEHVKLRSNNRPCFLLMSLISPYGRDETTEKGWSMLLVIIASYRPGRRIGVGVISGILSILCTCWSWTNWEMAEMRKIGHEMASLWNKFIGLSDPLRLLPCVIHSVERLWNWNNSFRRHWPISSRYCSGGNEKSREMVRICPCAAENCRELQLKWSAGGTNWFLVANFIGFSNPALISFNLISFIGSFGYNCWLGWALWWLFFLLSSLLTSVRI